MREDFIHYIWKYGAFRQNAISTVNGDSLMVIKLGQHNHNSGPDFFNAQIDINGQLWAGTVEIHVKSSDWYVHKHHEDVAYDNVILHVVWDHDADIFRRDNTLIPTLELKRFTDKNYHDNYNTLINSKLWINCEKDLMSVDNFVFNNWLERLYLERLELKSQRINRLLVDSKNDWESVLFKMLSKSFGLNVNGEAFYSVANSIDYSIVRKTRAQPLGLEALFLGQAGLLNECNDVKYCIDLSTKYYYLKTKYQLDRLGITQVKFSRLRPSNFPTIRLSQLAMLYQNEAHLFSKVIAVTGLDQLYEIFRIKASEFWKTHYSFKSTSRLRSTHLSDAFIDLLILNTIIPIKYSYAQSVGKAIGGDLIELVRGIKIETNSIVNKFLKLKPIEKTALNSQALLQLKKNYCDKNRCLSCAVGNSLILKN